MKSYIFANKILIKTTFYVVFTHLCLGEGIPNGEDCRHSGLSTSFLQLGIDPEKQKYTELFMFSLYTV